MVHRLRELLLQAFNKHLNKYEENMRALRESRNDPNWNFITYFLVQVSFERKNVMYRCPFSPVYMDRWSLKFSLYIIRVVP